MVKTEVSGKAAVTFLLPNTDWFIIGAAVVVVVLILVRQKRLQKSSPKTAVRP